MTKVDRNAIITRLRNAIAQYEARANPSPEDTQQYQEAKRLLASLLARRED